MINIPSVLQENNPKKSYGLNSGGFKRGMNSDPYTGNGFQIAENMKRENGIMKKMNGDNTVYDFGDVKHFKIEEYQKAAGGFQILVWYKDNSSGQFKMRAIEEDGTIVVPSPDLNFASESVSYEQIALTGYVCSPSNGYHWDGANFTSIAGLTATTYALGREGKSLTWLDAGIISFSRSDTNPITDTIGGATVYTNGEYSPNISGFPIGIYSGGTGTVVAFTSGIELHNKIEYDDGSGIRTETRNISFQYKGEGIDSKYKLTFGNYFIYIVTKKGIIQIDPVTGQSKNLLDEDKNDKSFRIKQYYELFNKSDARISYSEEEEMIIISLSSDGTGINNINICYNEVNGDFYIKKGHYSSFGRVGNSLYAGSSIDGKVFRVFDKETRSDGYGNILRTRVVNEWDAVSGMNTLTLPIDLFAFVSVESISTITLNLYINGDVSLPVKTIEMNSEDITDTRSLLGSYGNYTLGIGRSDNFESSDVIEKGQFTTPFHSYCWELIEESIGGFEITDFVLEYTQLEETSQTRSFSRDIFSL